MNEEAYISSGILEAYCLGQLSDQENTDVEKLALLYPEIKIRIRSLESLFEAIALESAVTPPPFTKSKIFHSLYKSAAVSSKLFPPFIEPSLRFKDIADWVDGRAYKMPEGFETTAVIDLPGDLYVTNFLIWTTQGHEPEIHHDYFEFITVLEGACVMTFEGEDIAYQKGDTINIPLHVTHSAKVTSATPMFALVQRQMMN